MNTSSTDLGVALQFDDVAQRREAATLGMWTFLATEILFFGVLFAAYIIGRVLYPDAFAEASKHTNLLLGAVETLVLLTSSLVMTLAVRGVQMDRHRAAAGMLAATATLGFAFLVIHGVEYYKEYEEHLVPRFGFSFSGPLAGPVELFFFLYYVTTAFHGLHVLVGVCAIGAAAARTFRGRYGSRRFETVELTGLYWHLVDIVWVFAFPCFYLVSRT